MKPVYTEPEDGSDSCINRTLNKVPNGENLKLLVGIINHEITKRICKKKIPIYTEDIH